MSEDDYIDIYDENDQNWKKLKKIYTFDEFDPNFWIGTGLEFDDSYTTLYGSIPETIIPVATWGTDFYVEENHILSPDVTNFIDLVKDLSSNKNLIESFEKINEVQDDIITGNLANAKILAIQLLKEFQREKSDFGIKRARELIKLTEFDLSNVVQKKKIIHESIYNNKISRCLLHKEIDAKCVKLNDIKETIETPEIFGFIMYQFLGKKFKFKNLFHFIKIRRYRKEQEKLKELITEINNNRLINIKYPKDSTSLEVKTCDFCKIARSYDFGILLLSPLNPNAFLEAGMFMSLGKRVILINNEKVVKSAPFDLTPFFYIKYRNVNELEANWNRKIPNFIEDMIKQYIL